MTCLMIMVAVPGGHGDILWPNGKFGCLNCIWFSLRDPRYRDCRNLESIAYLSYMSYSNGGDAAP